MAHEFAAGSWEANELHGDVDGTQAYYSGNDGWTRGDMEVLGHLADAVNLSDPTSVSERYLELWPDLGTYRERHLPEPQDRLTVKQAYNYLNDGKPYDQEA